MYTLAKKLPNSHAEDYREFKSPDEATAYYYEECMPIEHMRAYCNVVDKETRKVLRKLTQLDLRRAKTALTRSGKIVSNIQYVPKNSANRFVTYPIKGTIQISKRKTEYAIWTIDGVSDVVFGNKSNLDIVEILVGV